MPSLKNHLLKRWCAVGLGAAISLGTDGSLRAQERVLAPDAGRQGQGVTVSDRAEISIGGIIDFINRLSGPGPFIRFGPTISATLPEWQGFKLRATGLFGLSADMDGPPADVITVALEGERYFERIEVGAGVSTNTFRSNEFATITRVAFPLRVGFRIHRLFTVGVGANIFTGFKPEDFAPVSEVDSSTEIVWGYFLKFEP